MQYVRRSCGLIAAAVVAASAASAGASPAQSPTPVAGTPSCAGLITASFNHFTVNRFGNPSSSQGPGPFFGPATHEAIEELARGPNC
jgi:uncharacterized membrane protein